jgi:hypothetical protein
LHCYVSYRPSWPRHAPHRAKYFRKIFEKIRKKKDVLFWTGEQVGREQQLLTAPKARPTWSASSV